MRWFVVLDTGDKGIVGKNDWGEWFSEDGRVERKFGGAGRSEVPSEALNL